jgi:succinate dehydrogenase/fumarate reductase flavoprotein subunit
MTAKSLTTSIFQQLLGRDPAPGELGNFAAALNAAEQAAPSTTTTTSNYDATGQVVSQSSKTEGGLSAAGSQQLLADKVKGSTEYGVQQAATTFMNATQKAIWGTPQ